MTAVRSPGRLVLLALMPVAGCVAAAPADQRIPEPVRVSNGGLPFQMWEGALARRAADAACAGLEKALLAKGLEPLYDDRDERAGAKFATMDLIGLPWRITVGPRGIAAGKVELTSRRTGESEEMSPEAAVDQIAGIYAGR